MIFLDRTEGLCPVSFQVSITLADSGLSSYPGWHGKHFGNIQLYPSGCKWLFVAWGGQVAQFKQYLDQEAESIKVQPNLLSNLVKLH